MNKTILGFIALLSIFVIGCQPAAPAAPAQPPAVPAAPAAVEPQPLPPEAAPAGEGVPAPLENIPTPVRDGLDIERACYGLLAAEDFQSICGYSNAVVLTQKISEGGCWVNIADQRNNKLTAGFTTVDWDKSAEANEEFDRGVKARVKQGAVEGKVVGERSYEYDEIARHNIVWVTDRFLTRLAAMTDLCPADKLPALGQKIDAGLRQ